MKRFLVLAAIGLSVPFLSVKADEKHEHAKPAKNAGLAKMQKLIGTWVLQDAQGKPTQQVVSVFKFTGAGSAIQETIFPGEPHEMVTVYHADGKDLVLTHYCAAGNQPRMKLDPKSPANELNFVFTGGTNLDPAKDSHMHEGKIVLIDDTHIEWSWTGWDKGKPDTDHKVAMKLVKTKP